MICDIKTDSQCIAIKADSEDIHLGTSGIKNDLIISDSNLIKFKWLSVSKLPRHSNFQRYACKFGGSGRTRIFDLRCIRAAF